MNLYIYSDESGVFDYTHEKYYVFGGVIFLDKEQKDTQSRLYCNAEKSIYLSTGLSKNVELKAARLENKYKAKLYRSLNNCYKFGVVVEQNRVHKQIFSNKKSKQRYLDYVYKIAVKYALQQMMILGAFHVDQINDIIFYTDEHTTATNGRYELREALLQELKYGTFNFSTQYHYKPLFPHMNDVKLSYCDSAKTTLVRAADIVANRLYYYANQKDWRELQSDLFFIIKQP